ncbi:MAG: CD3324 family protein, partial [Clostridiaceae bacterium]
MRYINGIDVLPKELLNEVRRYAEGVYIYIPKSNLKKSKWGENTHYHREMELRNLYIYDKYLEGIEVEELAECYHLSIKSIRRIILLQKRKAEPMKAMIKEIMKQWNMEANPVQIYHSAWNINDVYVLKEYSDVKMLKRNIEMMKILYKEGIPVSKPFKLPKGDDYYEENGRMYVLTTKLKGKNIVDISQCDDQWFFDFGTILARLHIAFKACEEKISYWKNSMLEEMNGWVSSSLNKFHPEYLCEGDIKNSIFQLSQVYNHLPKQLIHRDVHLGNFLFDNKSFSGYIDFDLSQSNIRIFDLCYFL